MKKILGILSAVFVLLALCSCDSAPKMTLEERARTQLAQANGSWSVLIYMCGENGTKSADALRDLCQRDYPPNVNIVVQTGGDTQWNTDGINSDYLQRFVMQKGSMFLKDQKQSASMGDYETLHSFLTWGMENFPADRYMLVLMGDGTGTEVLDDKLYGDDSLTVEELSYAVSLSGRFDIIGFDGAYNASIENAVSLSPYAGYMIASEEKCAGWDYGRLADILIEYPYVEPNELGQLICDDYIEKCTKDGYPRMASLSVTDLSHISQLAQAFDGMADVMVSATDSLESYGRLARNALGAQRCVGSNDMVDLASLAAAIAENVGEPAQGVVHAIEQAVIYNVRGDLRPNANGLSVYYPQSIDADKLNLYMKAAVSDRYKQYIKCISPGVQIADEYVINGYEQSWAWCDYVGREFGCSSYMTPDSRYALKINGDMEIVKDVRLKKYFYYPQSNAYYSMGADNNLDCDWAGQEYMDNVTPIAPALNGNLVQADLCDEIRDVGKIYMTPILLNDQMGELISFYSWEKGKYEIVGVWQNGSPVHPKYRDRVATVHQVREQDGMILPGKVFKPFFGLRMQNKALPNGNYKLEYELTDVYSKARLADPANLDKNGNEIKIYQQ